MIVIFSFCILESSPWNPRGMVQVFLQILSNTFRQYYPTTATGNIVLCCKYIYVYILYIIVNKMCSNVAMHLQFNNL